MEPPLRIGLVGAAPWPPSDDASWRAWREAQALARRGHRVTVLVPGASADELARGRRELGRLGAGDADAIAGEAGAPRVVPVGRAIRAGARHVAGPLELAAGLEVAMRHGGFDVVHVHEPLLPSPALSALRHTTAVTAATFHRGDPLAGVAFLGPLVHRALGRVDVRIAVSPSVARALQELLPGDYEVLTPAVSARPPAAPPADGLLVVARGRDRAGLRFGLRVARALDGDRIGPVGVLGPREAPWRTRAAVPKALRTRLVVHTGDGPEAWGRALDDAAMVLLTTPADVAGPVAAEALARGRALLVPRCTPADDLLAHGADALVLPPFQRDAWVAAARGLVEDPAARARLSRPAAWLRDDDAHAARLERLYRAAAAAPRRREADARVTADLRLRPAPGADPARLARACRDAGLDVVAVASPEGVSAAHALAAAADPSLTVVAGREVATTAGVVVGLFLTEDVPDGLPLDVTLDRIRAGGGVTLVPHPEAAAIPAPAALRAVADRIDVRELATGATGPAGLEAARHARRQGLVVSAGSGAAAPEDVGGAGVAMRAFDGAADFLDALAEAEPVVPRRGRRTRARARARET